MLLFLFLTILSTIPYYDKYITKKIYNLKKSHPCSFQFSIYIIYFNLLINALLCYFYYQHIDMLLKSYFSDLFIINGIKWIISRKRPEKSLLINDNQYQSLFSLRIFDKLKIEQSFVSGHVAFVYNTYLFVDKYVSNSAFSHLYLLLTIVTFYSRINLGKHHFSDCMYALFLNKILNLLL